MKNKNLNIVAFYYKKPRPGVQTQLKGWAQDESNWQIDERVEVTRGLKKDSVDGKIILDLNDKRVVKNAWGDNRDFDTLFKYFFTGYHSYITAVMSKLDPVYFNKMLDEMQAELPKDEPVATE